MRRSWLLLTVGLLLVALFSGTAHAVSLWSDGPSLFADRRARNVGDLVTLIIVEKSEAQQKAATTTGQNAGVELGPGVGWIDVIPLLQLQGGDNFKSGGSTTRGGTLTARMTTQVVEVLPNGNLVIEGNQTIRINGEEQQITVRGTIRPEDIATDNTILSTFVADADITFVGTGSLGEKQSPGLLTRLFNWLF